MFVSHCLDLGRLLPKAWSAKGIYSIWFLKLYLKNKWIPASSGYLQYTCWGEDYLPCFLATERVLLRWESCWMCKTGPIIASRKCLFLSSKDVESGGDWAGHSTCTVNTWSEGRWFLRSRSLVKSSFTELSGMKCQTNISVHCLFHTHFLPI